VTDDYVTDTKDAAIPAEPMSPDRRVRVISPATRWVGAAMALVLAAGGALDFLSRTGVFGNTGDLALAGLTLVPLPIAVLLLAVARSFARGVIRTQWTLIGLGTLSVGVGSVIFVGLYAITGHDPYPSVADVFTLGGYALFAGALVLAIRAHRGLLDLRRPLLIAAAISTAAMALVYFTVIGPYVVFPADLTQPIVTRIFNTLYPVLDVFVLLMPTVALGLLVSRLGRGRVAWPWWCVVGGAGILAVTDTVFAYAGYVGAGRIPLVNFGYALAPMLLGFAVLVARDVYRS
jgi:hypothetical protein